MILKVTKQQQLVSKLSSFEMHPCILHVGNDSLVADILAC